MRAWTTSVPPFSNEEPILSNIEIEIEWTDKAHKKIDQLMAGVGEAHIALPPLECLPAEGDVLFLGPENKQQPFIVVERQYHHEGGADWTIILILDLP